MKAPPLLAPLLGLAVLAGPAPAAGPLELKDGDRVVLVGNTLIERAQRYGYWEAALTARFPARSVTFRNLGWSGDTVFGDARGSFGGPPEGYRRLVQSVRAADPTVLVVGYGSNEAFAGPAGLPRFVKGLETLLDAIGGKARVVLLSPLRHEDLGRPLPDPAAHNRNLRLYADAIRDLARQRDLVFVDLFDLLGDGTGARPAAPLTADGLHPTAWGYWRSAPVLLQGLGLATSPWLVEAGADGKVHHHQGARVEKVGTDPLRFRVTDDLLPPPPAPAEGAPSPLPTSPGRVLRVRGLAPGIHILRIDGKPLYRASAADWAKGVTLRQGPAFDQAERLRQAVVAKDLLYFHRWRPQNETYLFGFRKHEQGKNAREVPLFDPLVVQKEQEIARLRVPAAHVYELKAESH